jgi:hypothetical protein
MARRRSKRVQEQPKVVDAATKTTPHKARRNKKIAKRNARYDVDPFPWSYDAVDLPQSSTVAWRKAAIPSDVDVSIYTRYGNLCKGEIVDVCIKRDCKDEDKYGTRKHDPAVIVAMFRNKGETFSVVSWACDEEDALKRKVDVSNPKIPCTLWNANTAKRVRIGLSGLVASSRITSKSSTTSSSVLKVTTSSAKGVSTLHGV